MTAALLAAPLAGCAPARPPAAAPEDVTSRLAHLPGLAPAELDASLALIKQHPGELIFSEIPWLPALLDGRREAAEQGKPIVAFMMSGHPMGCT